MDPPHSSELWLDSRLLQDRIGGEAFAGRGVEREVPLGDWAMPDFVVALAVADERTAVRLQDALKFASEPIDHSGSNRHRAFVECHETQFVRSFATFWIDQVSVVFEQFGHHG